MRTHPRLTVCRLDHSVNYEFDRVKNLVIFAFGSQVSKN